MSGCDTRRGGARAPPIRRGPPTDGSKPVMISALAFGDADYAPLAADLGYLRRYRGHGRRERDRQSSGPTGPPAGSNATHQHQGGRARGSRTARATTRRRMFVQEPLPTVFERSFDIRARNHRGGVRLDGGASRPCRRRPDSQARGCRFGPTTLSTSSIPMAIRRRRYRQPTVEKAYMTRTRRVPIPPGHWTMRTRGGDPVSCGGSAPAPQVAMFAITRNHHVKARVNLDKTVIASNERVTCHRHAGVGAEHRWPRTSRWRPSW